MPAGVAELASRVRVFLYRLRIDRRYCVDALFAVIVCFDAIQVERRQFFVGQVAPGDRRVQVLDGLLHDQVFFRADLLEVNPGKLRIDERNLLVFVVGDALFLFGRERSWKRERAMATPTRAINMIDAGSMIFKRVFIAVSRFGW